MTSIERWLQDIHLEKYAPVFAEAEIDLLALPLLTDDDLVELGLPLGPRRKILDRAKRIDTSADSTANSGDPARAVINPTSQYARLAESANEPVAERRHLTVMFVDLVNSTD